MSIKSLMSARKAFRSESPASTPQSRQSRWDSLLAKSGAKAVRPRKSHFTRRVADSIVRSVKSVFSRSVRPAETGAQSTNNQGSPKAGDQKSTSYSATGNDGFGAGAQVVPGGDQARETKGGYSSVGVPTGEGQYDNRTQGEIARALGLPSGFLAQAQVEAEGNRWDIDRLTQTSLKEVTIYQFFESATQAQMDQLITFAAKEFTAENLYFLFAAEKLSTTAPGSEASSSFAKTMRTAFLDREAPFAPNLTALNKKRTESAIAQVIDGAMPDNLRQTLENARKNVIESFGFDTFRRFKEALPKT